MNRTLLFARSGMAMRYPLSAAVKNESLVLASLEEMAFFAGRDLSTWKEDFIRWSQSQASSMREAATDVSYHYQFHGFFPWEEEIE